MSAVNPNIYTQTIQVLCMWQSPLRVNYLIIPQNQPSWLKTLFCFIKFSSHLLGKHSQTGWCQPTRGKSSKRQVIIPSNLMWKHLPDRTVVKGHFMITYCYYLFIIFSRNHSPRRMSLFSNEKPRRKSLFFLSILLFFRNNYFVTFKAVVLLSLKQLFHNRSQSLMSLFSSKKPRRKS